MTGYNLFAECCWLTIKTVQLSKIFNFGLWIAPAPSSRYAGLLMTYRTRLAGTAASVCGTGVRLAKASVIPVEFCHFRSGKE
jgi:hypothetical protein